MPINGPPSSAAVGEWLNSYGQGGLAQSWTAPRCSMSLPMVEGGTGVGGGSGRVASGDGGGGSFMSELLMSWRTAAGTASIGTVRAG